MANENCQKIKLLKIMEIIGSETDEEHPIKTGELCERLRAMNITCDRRTLHRDMKLLCDWGYEIFSPLIDHERAYYIIDRSFSVPELKILLDAVQAASFITDKKTAELVDKIASLGGSNRGAILKTNLVCFNPCKHTNETIYYTVDALEDALRRRKTVTFRYFDLNEKHGKVFRKNGETYETEPVALVFNEDNYYLIAYTAKYGDTTNYRVDRMDSVTVTENDISAEAAAVRKKASRYTESVFKMYSGKPETVKLEFADRYIGAVYDKFGEDTSIIRVDDGLCRVTVKVQVSPTFFGWLAQFADGFRILAPDGVAAAYREHIEKILSAK